MREDAPLTEVVNVARAAVDQEFEITDRLDKKARGQVTLAGQWFAIAQAVSAVAYATPGVNLLGLALVGGSAIIGGGLMIVLFACSARVWRVRKEDAVHPHGLLQLKRDAEEEGAGALDVAITHYASLLQKRRQTNEQRGTALEASENWWYAAMALPLVQMVLALAVRMLA